MDKNNFESRFVPPDMERATKDERNRLGSYKRWRMEHNVPLGDPQLPEYLAYLIHERGLSPSSAKSHLATVRSRYRAMLKAGSLRQILTASGLSVQQIDATIAHIWKAIDPQAVKIDVKPNPARNQNLDDEHIQALIESPDTSQPMGLRDLTIILFMSMLGLTPNEVCALNVNDLHAKLNGQPALHVPGSLGRTERLIPYGQEHWITRITNAWLHYAGIREGAVFRGFYKSGVKLRDNRLSPRAVERLLRNYPIVVRGEPVVLNPIDLRHAYARHQYRLGVEVDTIRQHLGFSTIQPVMDYLGNTHFSDAWARPYQFDMSRLSRWEEYDGK